MSTAEPTTAEDFGDIGAMTVQERVAALIDPGSDLEIAALARSQQPSVAGVTPGDGVRTHLARVHGRNVAVIAEDADILSKTDGEVARAKRYRLLDLARITSVPMILVLDGPATSVPRFDPNAGELAGHLSDPRLDVDLRARRAPLISVVCGRVVGWARSVLGESDVVIATVGAASQLPSSAAAVIDIVCADVAQAIEAAKVVLDRLSGERHEGGHSSSGQAGDAWADDRFDATAIASHFCDDDGYLSFTHESSAVSVGLGQVDGWPTIIVAVGGSDPEVLTSSDLLRLVRCYRLSRRCYLPLLIVENCAGLDLSATTDFTVLSEIATEFRESNSLRICVITGDGHALGTFPLGSRQLGIDLFLAWPWARIGITDPPTDYSPGELDAVREQDPWLAAGRGLVDDVLMPSKSVESVRWLTSLYMANRDSVPGIRPRRRP